MAYNWINEIEDYEKELDGNSAIIVDICGLDNFLRLVDEFAKTQIYISTEPILRLKKKYIKKNKDNLTVRQLAKTLKVSESFVYKVMRE